MRSKTSLTGWAAYIELLVLAESLHLLRVPRSAGHRLAVVHFDLILTLNG